MKGIITQADTSMNRLDVSRFGSDIREYVSGQPTITLTIQVTESSMEELHQLMGMEVEIYRLRSNGATDKQWDKAVKAFGAQANAKVEKPKSLPRRVIR